MGSFEWFWSIGSVCGVFAFILVLAKIVRKLDLLHRELKIKKSIFDYFGKLFVAVNQGDELGSCETRFFDDVPVILFNLLDLVAEMKKVKDRRTEKFKIIPEGNCYAVRCVTPNLNAEKTINIIIETKDGGLDKHNIDESDAFRFAAQLLALCGKKER